MKEVVIFVYTLIVSDFSMAMIRQRRHSLNTSESPWDIVGTYDHFIEEDGKLSNCAPHARCMRSVYHAFTKEIKFNTTLCYCALGTSCQKVKEDPTVYIYKCQQDNFVKQILDRHLSNQGPIRPNTETEENQTICESNTPCMWTVYEPLTRKIKYNFTHVCQCGLGTSCQKTGEENLSSSAYIYKCRPTIQQIGNI